MKWPLQREAHARQDKIKKSDYREEIALEGDNFDRGGKEHPKLMPQQLFFRGNKVFVKIDVNHPSFKTDAQKILERVLRREMIFKADGFLMQLEWGKKTFCNSNQLQGQPYEKLYKAIRPKLEELYAITIKQFRRAEREVGGTEVIRDGRSKTCYKFKSALVPANTVKLETEDVVFDIDFIYNKKDSKQP